MASISQWVSGARPRTLPAAVAPVLVGTAAAYAVDGFVGWKALLALLVALALQIGVNYANDYSDGIRGTDDLRVGPFRLVGSGSAKPSEVKFAAFTAFGVGAVAGLVLALTSAWWLILIGAASIAAAWFYTGGARPYGYRGLGEVAVFVFFGPVAVLGTTFVQADFLTWVAWAGAVGVGALACAILVANNLRDLPTDRAVGKRTLAVTLGDAGTRWLYVTLLAVAYVLAVVIAFSTPWALLALLSAPLAYPLVQPVMTGAVGRDLIPVLAGTGRLELVYAILLGLGMVL
ncbi:MAG: 1,4-dihydroxy-2-naphthoate polyprenyltransferase [Longispora sp.]|nr:1,4-dihydroxy-2-naphthoate polyprenyltransferase [Longispora sp. (in: high G+C Gram-positive bacteria)]